MISNAVGSSHDDIMHILRKGYGKVIMISIAAGNPCDETTHRL